MQPGRLMVNFGFWDVVRARVPRPPGHFNRLVEHEVRRAGGIKSLYSDSYYTREEFWSIFDGDAYRCLKQRYDRRAGSATCTTSACCGAERGRRAPAEKGARGPQRGARPRSIRLLLVRVQRDPLALHRGGHGRGGRDALDEGLQTGQRVRVDPGEAAPAQQRQRVRVVEVGWSPNQNDFAPATQPWMRSRCLR